MTTNMMIQSGYICRRNLNIGGILLILVVTSIYVATETEIVDVWKQVCVTFFHMRDSFHISWHRPPFQKWVFGVMECSNSRQ